MKYYEELKSLLDTCTNKCTTDVSFTGSPSDKCQAFNKINEDFFGDPIIDVSTKSTREFLVDNDIIRIENYGGARSKVILKNSFSNIDGMVYNKENYFDYKCAVLKEAYRLVGILKEYLKNFENESGYKFQFFGEKVVLNKRINYCGLSFVTFVQNDKIKLRFKNNLRFIENNPERYEEDYMTIGGYNFSEFWIKYKPILIKDILEYLDPYTNLVNAFEKKYDKYLMFL